MIIKKEISLSHTGVKGMKWGHRKGTNQSSNKTTYIKKGTTVHHVSKSKVIDLSNNRIYASYKVKDLQRYQYVIGQLWTTKKLYDHSYSLNNALKIPSKKEQQGIYNELSKNHKDLKKVMEKFVGEKLDKSIDMNDAYVELLGAKGLPFVSEYKDIAKKLGYNALVDYNDKGRNSESPIIILDAAKSLSKTLVTELDPNKIERGQKFVDELRRLNEQGG